MGKMLNKMKNITVSALRPRNWWIFWLSVMDDISTGTRMIVKRFVLRVMSSVYLLIFG